ncbi:MAG: SMP-30/gluconolactonase/LRE family protein [Melioribacteraceae bacterium]|nr:SMP-30/gluconolactonase/LRE family protein [Melioribacteraceae bacterium]
MLAKKEFPIVIILFLLIIILSQSKIISQSLLDPNAKVEEITSGIQQPEGPVWSNNNGLLFSDIKGNIIYKWSDEKGKEIYLNPSDSTNGLTYDLDGNLVAGQMGLRRIVRFESDGSQTSLADNYEGKKLNSPNDLIVKSDGSIFFTDPDFNIPQGQKKELDFNGIYRISPSGNLQLLDKLALPNGICFSPDESKLYVNDSQAHKIYVWDVVDDSTITNKKLFFTVPIIFGYADGMKIDSAGNIYCTCSSSVWVISPSGDQLGKIDLPANVSASNCTWGDTDRKTLFITAGKSVYKIRPLITGIKKHITTWPEKIKLFQNYPNPFNPETNINYSLPEKSYVSLKVFDVLGKEVKTLYEGLREPGDYTLKFNGMSLASGVYYYMLESEKYSDSKKMIIIK